MITIKIQGKEWPLAFTLGAMDRIEESTGKAIGELGLRMNSKADREELLQVLAAMMCEATEDDAQTPTVEQMRRAMRPGELMAALKQASVAISEGMRMETEEPDEDEEVDLVLEEIKKKEPPGV